MKQLIITLILLAGYATSWAQFPNWNEWFRQKKTQRRYLVNQIAALKTYARYMKKGYDIAQKGLTAIADIKNGTHNLDKDYFNSLKEVKPFIRNSPKAYDILASQQRILRDMRRLRNDARLDENFTGEEIAYIDAVYRKMLSESSDAVDELTLVLTTGETEMKDDERLERLDKVHEEMLDKVAFVHEFISTTRQLSAQRGQEHQQLNNQTLLYQEL